MKFSLAANAVQARQTKERFAKPEEQLSYELGKAVQELPPLYTRLLAGTISFIILGTISWAHFSEIDEVATATGELIASTQVRPVTALGNGSILAVKVKEGDRVTKDQILIQRDPNFQQTDVNRLAKSSKLIEDDLQRLQAERSGGKTAGTILQDELLNSRLLDYKAKQAAAAAEAKRQQSILNQAKVRLSRLQENLANAKVSFTNVQKNLENVKSLRSMLDNNLSIAQQREENLRTLVEPGALTRVDYLDAKERLNRANADIIRNSDEITKNQNNLTEAKYYYIGESHAAYDSTDSARVWHKDLRGDFSKENNSLNILRVLIYLQDHKNYSYGTKIIKKSHKQTLYPFWSIKYFVKTLLETFSLLKKKHISYKNLIPVNIFKATNLEVESGDVAIWSLNIIHSGNYVRLKIFPNLVLPVFLDKYLDKYFKKFLKIDKNKRAIVSFTFGKKCLTTTNYITERISKNAIPSCYASNIIDLNSSV